MKVRESQFSSVGFRFGIVIRWWWNIIWFGKETEKEEHTIEGKNDYFGLWVRIFTSDLGTVIVLPIMMKIVK